MNREELKQFVPHREPMLLVDEAYLDEDGTAHAKYLVREDDFFCRGHFPGNPMVPGVIQCEIMAQGCVMLVKDDIPGKATLYTGIDKMRFKKIVKPGDVCEVTAKLKKRRGSFFFCEAVLRVDGQICCKGDLSFAII